MGSRCACKVGPCALVLTWDPWAVTESGWELGETDGELKPFPTFCSCFEGLEQLQ